MMEITPLPIAGAALVRSKPFEDERGSFTRVWCSHTLDALLEGKPVVQSNLSRTVQTGVLRGMHYQLPPAQDMRLVRTLRGRVFDVIVDLRKDSPTYLQWHGETLTPKEWGMVVVPEGCAHGFQTLEPDSEMLYMHTASYAPEHEAGIRYDDPAVGIDWPLAPTLVSPRDAGHPLIDADFQGVLV